MANHFNLAKVVLAEPREKFRKEIEDVLKSMGFIDITSTGNLSAAEEVLQEKNISLFIADTSLPEGDLNETVKKIRMSKLGGNPFVVCLTMIADPSEERTQEVVNSGVDDIALKPFPVTQIRDRIAMLAHSRPRFIVASDYIGPSRREADHDKEEDNLFVVPNPLASSISLHNYNCALKIIKEHRIVRDGLKINELSSKVIGKIGEGISVSELKKELEWLNRTADDLDERLKESVNKPVRAMIMTLRNLTAKITTAGIADAGDIDTLEKLGFNISSRFDKKRLAFSIEEHEIQTVRPQKDDSDDVKNFISI
ncbi:MAG: response regulator [Rhodospirillales bacterium]|nr:response regulator [Rhodospirillales bacterium]